MGLYIPKVSTPSRATAVQIARKSRGQRTIVEHVGSAHDDHTLTVLMAAAEQRKAQLRGGQQLALEFGEECGGTAPPAVVADAQPRMVGTVHRVLREVLAGVYDRLGFSTAVESEVFKKLVIARLIEPASKLRSLEILASLGIGKVPS